MEHTITYTAIALMLGLTAHAMATSSCSTHTQSITFTSAEETQYIVPIEQAELVNACQILIDEHDLAQGPLTIPLEPIGDKTLELIFGSAGKEGYLKLINDHLADCSHPEYISAHVSEVILTENLSAEDTIRLFLDANALNISTLTKACATLIGKHAPDYWEVKEPNPKSPVHYQKTNRHLEVKEDSCIDVLPPELKRMLACTLFDIKSTSKSVYRGHTEVVRAIAITPDNKTLLSGSDDKTLRILDLKTLKLIGSPIGHASPVASITLAADGTTIASGSYDNTIRISDLRTLQLTNQLKKLTHWVSSLATSPDGKTLASGSYDKKVHLWDLRTFQPINQLEGPTDWVNSVAISPNGTTLASGSYDKKVHIWDLRTFQPINQLEGHAYGVSSVAISPNGATLASGSYDNNIHIYNLKTFQQINKFEEHTYCVRSVAFSSDGTTLVSGSDDTTVCIWDLKTSQPINQFKGHTNRVRSVVITTNGSTVVSGSDDGTIRTWQLKNPFMDLLNSPEQDVDDIILRHLNQ